MIDCVNRITAMLHLYYQRALLQFFGKLVFMKVIGCCKVVGYGDLSEIVPKSHYLVK